MGTPSVRRRRRERVEHVAATFLVLCSQVHSFVMDPTSLSPFRNHSQLEQQKQQRHARNLSGSREQPCLPVLEATALDRADFVKAAAAVLVATSGVTSSQAAEVSAPPDTFVDFVDSRGLFSMRIPDGFLRAERSKDKKGVLFVAGDYNKAEVLSVQTVSAYDLLTDAGMPTIGGLSKWEELGKPRLVAELLKQRRDADAAGGAQVESVVLPGIKVEGDVLQFTLRSPIKVMRVDLLEKERGVSELYRNTLVKAVMRGDGTFLVLWAGALNTDWDEEGGAKDRLGEVRDSFQLEGLVVDGIRLGAA